MRNLLTYPGTSSLPLLASMVSAIESVSLVAPPLSHAGESVSVEFLSSFLVSPLPQGALRKSQGLCVLKLYQQRLR